MPGVSADFFDIHDIGILRVNTTDTSYESCTSTPKKLIKMTFTG